MSLAVISFMEYSTTSSLLLLLQYFSCPLHCYGVSSSTRHQREGVIVYAETFGEADRSSGARPELKCCKWRQQYIPNTSIAKVYHLSRFIYCSISVYKYVHALSASAAFSKLVAYVSEEKHVLFLCLFQKTTQKCWGCCRFLFCIMCSSVHFGWDLSETNPLSITQQYLKRLKCVVFIIPLNYFLGLVFVGRPVFPTSRYGLRRSYLSCFAADFNYRPRKKEKRNSDCRWYK